MCAAVQADGQRHRNSPPTLQMNQMPTEALFAARDELELVQQYVIHRLQTIGKVLAERGCLPAAPTAIYSSSNHHPVPPGHLQAAPPQAPAATYSSSSQHPAAPGHLQRVPAINCPPGSPQWTPPERPAGPPGMFTYKRHGDDNTWWEWYCNACSKWVSDDHLASPNHNKKAANFTPCPTQLVGASAVPLAGNVPPYSPPTAVTAIPAAAATSIRLTPAAGQRSRSRSSLPRPDRPDRLDYRRRSLGVPSFPGHQH